ncbi:MAG: tripartite tricarboxylate transporter TctB family protein [Syntrophaceae bacterium]|nr:tripartite tricarboxylate transporter TctB family protein [Syntrophaceae bacterium]
MKRDEIIVGIVIFIFGGITAAVSLRMPIGTFRMPGTGMFPLLLGILLMILSGILVLRLFFQGRQIRVKSEPSGESLGSPVQLILFLGTMVFITLFFNQLGYPLSSFLLMVALLRILGVKRWTLNLPLSFVTAVVSYFVFVQWLQIPLPKGWIGL